MKKFITTIAGVLFMCILFLCTTVGCNHEKNIVSEAKIIHASVYAICADPDIQELLSTNQKETLLEFEEGYQLAMATLETDTSNLDALGRLRHVVLGIAGMMDELPIPEKYVKSINRIRLGLNILNIVVKEVADAKDATGEVPAVE